MRLYWKFSTAAFAWILEVATIAGRIIALLGLTQAAEPLPPRILSLFDRHESG
jgi:hypothetical protein